MSAKQMMFSDDARQKILAGVNKLAKAVKSTMGPTGHNVVYQKGFGGPGVTKDGVTVAKEVTLEDKFETMVAPKTTIVTVLIPPAVPAGEPPTNIKNK